MKAIVNAKLVLESGLVYDGVLLTEEGKIVAYGNKRTLEIPENAEIIDADGAYAGPGFVDIHVHGGETTTTYADPQAASDFFVKHGTTSFLATPSYGRNFDEFIAAFASVRACMGKVKGLRGIYAEGPYTSPDFGAGKNKNPWRHPIDAAQYTALVDAAGTDIRVWTIAPEREGICAFLDYARKINPEVRFALGHSRATPMQVRALGKNIPSIMTHTFNATGRIPVPGGTRGYGPDEYCLQTPDMYAELISDSAGMHVHPEMQKLLLHCKGAEKICLITDRGTSAVTRQNPPGYEQYTDLNIGDNGELSGSRLTMNQCCRNFMTATGASIAQVFRMASGNPARAVGLFDEIGSIDIGKAADLAFVDDQFNVLHVMRDGEMEF